MNQVNHFTIEAEKMMLSSGEIISFPYPVQKAIEFDHTIVVMLDAPPGTRYNENVFGIDRNGNVVWQIEKRPSPYPDTAYLNLNRAGDNAKLNNYDGSELIVEPHTGKILEERYTK